MGHSWNEKCDSFLLPCETLWLRKALYPYDVCVGVPGNIIWIDHVYVMKETSNSLVLEINSKLLIDISLLNSYCIVLLGLSWVEAKILSLSIEQF